MEGMTLEKLQVIIEAQTAQYMNAMKKVQNQTNSTVAKVNSSLDKVKGALGTIGRIVGIAFSITALVNFGRACIKVGSDLAEVQNVVDVTFGAGNKTIENFAKNAAEQFGLSELAAKQYTSTMGAMLKSMGITGKALEDMSVQLAGLAGDMASFYNLDTDQAFQKIRAGISGETEPLKQLGINLSVANLEQFALNQGMGKAYKNMTQQEQALLRYNYLLSVTADAQGDFARTSDSWANQTRILQLRFESLKATIGQGLINVFTPILKVLNMLIAKLQVAAAAFRRFTEIITGKSGKSAAQSTGTISSSLGGATNHANALAGATKKAGGAAKKAEEAYHGLTKFDEINSLTKKADDSGSGGGGGGEDVGDSGITDMTGAVEEAAGATDEKLNPILKKLMDRLKELRDLFMQGFKAGMGDVTLEPLKKAVESIRKSLIAIWTDPGVLAAANKCLDKWAYALGQITGAVASIGITIATNLVGGLAKYLEQNTDRIKRHLITMFDISGSIAEISGNFAQAVANIFSVFGSDTGQQVTANIIGIFADAYMGVEELAGKATRDILDVFTRPFIDNQEGIKTALMGILEVFEEVTGSIKDAVDHTMDKANEVYDASIKPVMDDVARGLSETAGIFIDTWNGRVKPVLDEIAQKFDELMGSHIQPMINSVLKLIGAISEELGGFYNEVLKPMMDWVIENIIPVIADVVGRALGILMDALSWLADRIVDLNGFLEKHRGIIEGIITVVGAIAAALALVMGAIAVFSGIMATVGGIITGVVAAFEYCGAAIMAIVGLVTSPIGVIVSAIAAVIAIGVLLYRHWDEVKEYALVVWEQIKAGIQGAIETIESVIGSVMQAVNDLWNAIWTSIFSFVSAIWNNIQVIISTGIMTIQNIITTILQSIYAIFSSIFNAVKSLVVTVFNAIKTVITTIISGIKNNISTMLSSIKTIWSNSWNSLKTTVVTIFNSMWSAIKGVINSIIGGIEGMANAVVNGVNVVINALNGLSFDVPDWVPELGGKTFGFSIPTLSSVSLPRLAKGGIVNGATPLIAGEAGKEAIMPLENNTGWIDSIANRVAEILSVNIMGALESQTDGDYQVITHVDLDGKTIATQIDKYRKRTGFNMKPEPAL